jgi:hypothetical protein
MDESSNYLSSTRPSAKRLWKPSLGVLELGIHGANNLLPMKSTKDSRGSTDAYCVAKYGPKWIRTRTIFDSFNPRWNEQYTWEVDDPCTVLTVGVFDNRYVHGLDLGFQIQVSDTFSHTYLLSTYWYWLCVAISSWPILCCWSSSYAGRLPKGTMEWSFSNHL